METLKRYWNALTDDARRFLKKAVIVNTVLGALLSLALILLFSDFIFEGSFDGDSFLQRWSITGLIVFVNLAFATYSYYLIFRTHKAIKELLFSKPAPGRKTPETWTGGDGFLLAVALIGITCILQAPIALILALVMPDIIEPEISDFLWPAVGIFLGPVAAKRYIPLDGEAETK